ncbi:MAG: hypothetical protein QNJ31_01370 [Candidatus Caenarcaniphilales bacterium]|nr:hypothetical protein [Candidatus Caenarcaniphilales bacterium]
MGIREVAGNSVKQFVKSHSKTIQVQKKGLNVSDVPDDRDSTKYFIDSGSKITTLQKEIAPLNSKRQQLKAEKRSLEDKLEKSADDNEIASLKEAISEMQNEIASNQSEIDKVFGKEEYLEYFNGQYCLVPAVDRFTSLKDPKLSEALGDKYEQEVNKVSKFSSTVTGYAVVNGYLYAYKDERESGSGKEIQYLGKETGPNNFSSNELMYQLRKQTVLYRMPEGGNQSVPLKYNAEGEKVGGGGLYAAREGQEPLSEIAKAHVDLQNTTPLLLKQIEDQIDILNKSINKYGLEEQNADEQIKSLEKQKEKLKNFKDEVFAFLEKYNFETKDITINLINDNLGKLEAHQIAIFVDNPIVSEYKQLLKQFNEVFKVGKSSLNGLLVENTKPDAKFQSEFQKICRGVEALDSLESLKKVQQNLMDYISTNGEGIDKKLKASFDFLSVQLNTSIDLYNQLRDSSAGGTAGKYKEFENDWNSIRNYLREGNQNYVLVNDLKLDTLKHDFLTEKNFDDCHAVQYIDIQLKDAGSSKENASMKRIDSEDKLAGSIERRGQLQAQLIEDARELDLINEEEYIKYNAYVDVHNGNDDFANAPVFQLLEEQVNNLESSINEIKREFSQISNFQEIFEDEVNGIVQKQISEIVQRSDSGEIVVNPGQTLTSEQQQILQNIESILETSEGKKITSLDELTKVITNQIQEGKFPEFDKYIQSQVSEQYRQGLDTLKDTITQLANNGKLTQETADKLNNFIGSAQDAQTIQGIQTAITDIKSTLSKYDAEIQDLKKQNEILWSESDIGKFATTLLGEFHGLSSYNPGDWVSLAKNVENDIRQDLSIEDINLGSIDIVNLIKDSIFAALKKNLPNSDSLDEAALQRVVDNLIENDPHMRIAGLAMNQIALAASQNHNASEIQALRSQLGSEKTKVENAETKAEAARKEASAAKTTVDGFKSEVEDLKKALKNNQWIAAGAIVLSILGSVIAYVMGTNDQTPPGNNTTVVTGTSDSYRKAAAAGTN